MRGGNNNNNYRGYRALVVVVNSKVRAPRPGFFSPRFRVCVSVCTAKRAMCSRVIRPRRGSSANVDAQRGFNKRAGNKGKVGEGRVKSERRGDGGGRIEIIS